MGLSDLKHISTISSVSAKTSVTKNSKTGTVWKCIVNNLEYKILPSPDSGSRYEGMALIMDSSGNIGAFIMVAANPKSSAAGSINAREIWLDTWPLTSWQTEFGAEQAAKFTELTSPSAGLRIAFMDITGPNPLNANNITPESFSGGCVECTQKGNRENLVEEVMKLKASLDAVNAPSLSNLLLSNYSIFSGSLLSWTSGLSVPVSSGSALFKGVEFPHAGGTITGFADKTLYRATVDNSGTYALQEENSTEGTSILDYNPAGTGAGQLPTALVAGCSKTGTASVESVTNGVLTLTVAANSCFYTALANSINPSATGAFGAYILQYVSGSGFQAELDNGTGNGLATISLFSDRIQAHDGQIFYLDTTKPFTFRFSNKLGICRVWINGQLALTINSLLATSGSNRIRFGFISSSTGSVNIARIRVRNLITAETGAPSFATLNGAVLGSIVSINSAFSSPIGLRSTAEDINLGHRKEGNILIESDLTKKNQSILGNNTFTGLNTFTNLIIPTTSFSAATYTALSTDNVIRYTGTANATLTLPTAAGNTDKEYLIINSSTTQGTRLTIDANSTETINGSLAWVLFPNDNDYVKIKSNGTNWIVINRKDRVLIESWNPTAVVSKNFVFGSNLNANQFKLIQLTYVELGVGFSGGQIYCRFSMDGGSTYVSTASYHAEGLAPYNITPNANGGDFNLVSILDGANNVFARTSGNVILSEPFNSSLGTGYQVDTYGVNTVGGASQYALLYRGFFGTVGAIQGIQVGSTGNFGASGNISVYGLRG